MQCIYIGAMTETFPSLRRIATLVGLAVATTLLLLPALARADTPSTLNAVGTSDVNDSGLIPNLIKPEFQAAYPQFTFTYHPSATGAAINAAKAGGTTTGPSILIVHAASLENSFVGDGYSYNQYGNAIFTNDFVLAGPTGDPAGVGANAAHNIAQAFVDVATAGVAGHATFITRGGTSTASGTTVEEHEIWALVNSSHLTPTGVVLCNVSTADGGGMSPIKPSVQATSGQACPDTGTVDGTDAPPWYYVNSMASQGANVIATNACTVGSSGPNTCYVLTDRGTYDYLSSGSDPAGAIPNLGILTRDNAATAPGGANELTNYFHVYIINPARPNEADVNLTAAKDFVNFLTSPSFQNQLSSYLDDTSDPGGAPFKADASPIITSTTLPSTVNAGSSVTVSGSVTNAEQGAGYVEPVGQTVSVDEIVAGVPVVVNSAKIGTGGTYSITFKPTSSGAYQVATPQMSLVENASLSPVYGDILSPAATTASPITVVGLPAPHTLTFKSVKVSKGKFTVTGALKPGPALSGAKVELFALRTTGPSGQKKVATVSVGKGKTKFTIKGKLKRGFKWILQLEYVQKGQTSTWSGLKTVAVH
jgi:tungstate transport system substrate-binding protein